MQNQDFRHKNPSLYRQSGNALWFILVAIALLAALTLTITRNSGKVADNLDDEQARVIAERIARDMTSYAAAVDRLRAINGCGEEELSFEASVVENIVPGFTDNPRSPTTGPRAYTCHLFDKRGGGMAYLPLPDGATTPDAFGDQAKVGYFFTAANSVNGVGPESVTETICASNCGDLVVGTSGINDSVCAAYNSLIGIDVIPEDNDMYTSLYFDGTYATANNDDARINEGSGDASSVLYGVKTACVFSSASPTPHNTIYKVLVAR